MVATAILNFETRLLLLIYLTDLHQTQWKHCDFD